LTWEKEATGGVLQITDLIWHGIGEFTIVFMGKLVTPLSEMGILFDA
jgi:hypothetical protein